MARATSPVPNRAIARVGTLIVIGLIALVLLGLTVSAWRNISPGYVGIIFDKASHQVTTGALEPGWAFINPFTQAIQQYPVTIQTYSMVQKATEGQTTGDDSIKVQSNEGQQINLDVVIQYQVIKEEAGLLYQDWGGADITTVEDRVVRQYTRSQVPVVASKYGWEEITSSKRDVINADISKGLDSEFAKRHMRLISFAVREVHLPQALQTALDQKIQAQQQAEQQKYQLEQAKVKAEQDVAQATGQANALKAQAEGEAQATLTRAKAQAEANRQLAQSLTPELIRYQQLQRWDGKLPIFSGGNATPLIDTTSIISGTAGR
ncbi:MAG TPA: SPFH domain-containing protein [Roseiflexaceae bacterium]|nr:SPFH domain-containing protein [Roseiflexaceae bacterium]